ncbi:DNA internalization-related competence protein ComEC/Rec2 [Pararobbsia silviterrae]|uniref:DNA internalization-related competence protein ComEC/Rec2 n=1 Tax=Pararobbsia silviterrae TaxID=1792498 RepID=A0A494X857_9BURK|nr:DNA internalization-related competence protein ComEC/Rec2 [Pararobbsia silviterrae]RKP46640.1 DNA internalization-related competence protein ComEC/Rec2 [Pararobbsia silviterrae]
MRVGVCAFAFGVLVLQQSAQLPDRAHGAALGIVLCVQLGACAVWRWRAATSRGRTRLRRGFEWVWIVSIGIGVGYLYAGWRAHLRLDIALPAAVEGRDLGVEGRVSGLPVQMGDAWRFDFDLSEIDAPRGIDAADIARIPRRVSLTYQTERTKLSGRRDPIDPTDRIDRLPPIWPGERWHMTVRLRRPHRPVNFDTPFPEADLFARNIRATGTVRERPVPVRVPSAHDASTLRIALARLRADIRARIEHALGNAAHAGIVVALAIGDASGVSADDQRRFARTGTRHLIAVSGLHVSLVAGAIAGLASLAWRRLFGLRGRAPLWWATPRVAAVCGGSAALAYAALAGFGVPALRAFVMFATGAAATLADRRTTSSIALCAALGGVVLIDPWAVVSVGFWLSFGAVAAMLWFGDARRVPSRDDGILRTVASGLSSAARAQWAVTIALVPPALAFFSQIPLLGPVANAFAIPWASFIVTPLTLIGVIVPAPLDAYAWRLAHAALDALMTGADWLASPRWAVLELRAPDACVLALSIAGAIWMLTPRGWPMRWAGWWLWLPLAWPGTTRPPPGEFRVTVLDVGQGAAAFVETHAHGLLFDTGPSYGEAADAGQAIVAPALKAQGVTRLDRLVISHADADHIGGAASVAASIDVEALLASLPGDDTRWRLAGRAAACAAGQTWNWDGVTFEMRWPPADARVDAHARNATSCVLRVSNAALAVLLPGDIEAAQERALVAAAPGALRADLLLAPHHGSRTSSTEAFLDAVAPRDVVFQVGYRNRFGHPHSAIVARYAAHGVRLHRSDRDGAVRATTSAGVMTIERARETRHRYWMDD